MTLLTLGGKQVNVNASPANQRDEYLSLLVEAMRDLNYDDVKALKKAATKLFGRAMADELVEKAYDVVFERWTQKKTKKV